MPQSISIRNHVLKLLPEKAIFWLEEEALLLADLHLGKAGHFRRHGIPISGQTQISDLDKLCLLLDQYQPQTVYFLGDLFHSDYNQEWEQFCQRIRPYDCRFILIQGNHDFLSAKHYEAAGLTVCHRPLQVGPFVLGHEPAERPHPDGYFLCGHLHPGIRMAGNAKQKLRFPCFWQQAYQLILPAFGGFTGLYIVSPSPEEVVFPIVDRQVMRFPI